MSGNPGRGLTDEGELTEEGLADDAWGLTDEGGLAADDLEGDDVSHAATKAIRTKHAANRIIKLLPALTRPRLAHIHKQ
jgi:hypothetical protein